MNRQQQEEDTRAAVDKYRVGWADIQAQGATVHVNIMTWIGVSIAIVLLCFAYWLSKLA